MGKTFEAIDDKLAAFIGDQQMFFVASAPLSGGGLVNLSPKGLFDLRILDPQTVVYLDLTGSGAETIAHMKENGRLVIMFCAFGEAPKILRLHGCGEVVENGDEEFDELRALYPETVGLRSFIKLHVEHIADSCGWGVPMYEYQGQRDTYPRYVEQKGAEGIRKGQLKSNMTSLDGLPALRAPSV